MCNYPNLQRYVKSIANNPSAGLTMTPRPHPHLANRKALMSIHSHHFVETYDGMVGFGFNRQTDEKTVIYYLQKFSDDALMEALVKRMTDEELSQIFELISGFLRRHLSEPEYHRLFLKEARRP
jgi:hypothetical protein